MAVGHLLLRHPKAQFRTLISYFKTTLDPETSLSVWVFSHKHLGANSAMKTSMNLVLAMFAAVCGLSSTEATFVDDNMRLARAVEDAFQTHRVGPTSNDVERRSLRGMEPTHSHWPHAVSATGSLADEVPPEHGLWDHGVGEKPDQGSSEDSWDDMSSDCDDGSGSDESSGDKEPSHEPEEPGQFHRHNQHQHHGHHDGNHHSHGSITGSDWDCMHRNGFGVGSQ